MNPVAGSFTCGGRHAVYKIKHHADVHVPKKYILTINQLNMIILLIFQGWILQSERDKNKKNILKRVK
jgi:hypothetical protein